MIKMKLEGEKEDALTKMSKNLVLANSQIASMYDFSRFDCDYRKEGT